MEIKLAEYQTKPSESEDLAQLNSHLQQCHESLHLDIIDSDSEENHIAVLEPAPPIGYDNAGVDNGKEGYV